MTKHVQAVTHPLLNIPHLVGNNTSQKIASHHPVQPAPYFEGSNKIVGCAVTGVLL